MAYISYQLSIEPESVHAIPLVWPIDNKAIFKAINAWKLKKRMFVVFVISMFTYNR